MVVNSSIVLAVCVHKEDIVARDRFTIHCAWSFYKINIL